MTIPYVGPVAHSSGTDNLPINRIVIHCTAGADAKGARGTAKYFQDSNAAGSAHYVTDPNETVQCAFDNVVCWHAPPNKHSLGIEICCSLSNDGKGHWELDSHVTMMQHAAMLTAIKCVQYNIPVNKLSPSDLVAGKRGICGHVDVTNAFHQSTHTDPGSYFPWPQFMQMVRTAVNNLTAKPSEPDMPLSQDDLDKIEAITKKYAIANNEYLRQMVDDIGNYTAAATEALAKNDFDAVKAQLSNILSAVQK